MVRLGGVCGDGADGRRPAGVSHQSEDAPAGRNGGEGLFRFLRGFQGSDQPQRAVVGTIFRNTQNRMADGYLLRNVVNLVDGIHFDSSEEIHTLGHLYDLYESMLKEMRDAAGDSGEFYTPLLAWWREREENAQAWRVAVGDVLRYDENGALVSANLDVKNPNRRDEFEHLPPEQLVRDILEKERQIIALMEEIEQALAAGSAV